MVLPLLLLVLPAPLQAATPVALDAERLMRGMKAALEPGGPGRAAGWSGRPGRRMVAVDLMPGVRQILRNGVMLMDEPMADALGWWAILVANLLASTTMLAYFLSRHPGLAARLQEHWASDR